MATVTRSQINLPLISEQSGHGHGFDLSMGWIGLGHVIITFNPFSPTTEKDAWNFLERTPYQYINIRRDWSGKGS